MKITPIHAALLSAAGMAALLVGVALELGVGWALIAGGAVAVAAGLLVELPGSEEDGDR